MSDAEGPKKNPPPRHFPPLPPVKPPPPGRGTDPRQTGALRMAEGLAGRLPSAVHTGVGFRASAVDLGELKELLEAGTRRITMAQLEARFDDDLRGFIHSVVTSWVQNPREIVSELHAHGIRVRIVTEDDFGAYTYLFDVLPRSS
jgi:hypothetical protein